MPLPHVRYLGLHGWESSATKELSQPTQAFLRQAICLLTRRIRESPIVDRKQRRHFRAALSRSRGFGDREAHAALRNILDLFADPSRDGGRVRVRSTARELTGKGVAARSEWLTFRRALPVYVGNDATDEAGFAALSTGITVRVGRTRSTHARFHLSNPAAYARFWRDWKWNFADSKESRMSRGDILAKAHPMLCPVCAALNREHTRECEVEAKAILQQRSRWLTAPDENTSASDEKCHEVVLTSRKRQIQITSKLDMHKAKGHAA